MMRFVSVIVFTAIACTWPSDVVAGRKEDAKRCTEVKQKIREIEERMRRGYSAAQGIRLDERLRKLKDERYKVCR